MNLFDGRHPVIVHQALKHQVAEIKDPNTIVRARVEVCGGCPWRKSNAGNFPAEAFAVSRQTCAESSIDLFMCHESGWEKPAICAGFILANPEHRAVKLLTQTGVIDQRAISAPEPMFDSYIAMETANGG